MLSVSELGKGHEASPELAKAEGSAGRLGKIKAQ